RATLHLHYFPTRRSSDLSCLDAFHYLGFNQLEAKKWAITAIFAIGAMNLFGPKHSGGIAVWFAVPTLVVVIILICSGLPHMDKLDRKSTRLNSSHVATSY